MPMRLDWMKRFNFSPNAESEQAFKAAILANPEDPAPRLVFADWLEERGRMDDARFWRIPPALLEACGTNATATTSIDMYIEGHWSLETAMIEAIRHMRHRVESQERTIQDLVGETSGIRSGYARELR